MYSKYLNYIIISENKDNEVKCARYKMSQNKK